MATVTFAPTVDSSVEEMITQISIMIFDAEIVSQSLTESVFEFEDFTYYLTVSASGGGTIEGLVVEENDQPYMGIANLGISVADFDEAAEAEGDGTDLAALENLFLSLDWEYIGNDNDDIHLSTAVTDDGVPLNFTGDDTIYLNGGNDNFALGDGNDYAEGGDGNDTLFGGKGSDNLLGGDGDDKLYGNKGADTLIGGLGFDYFEGGKGDDIFIGGIELDDATDAGWDIVSYLNESGGQGIVVDMAAGTAIDTFGNTDTLNGIEMVWGSVLADKMVGSDGDDSFRASDGKDILKGKGGDDRLEGGKGADIVKGGAGNDDLYGDFGNDKLFGGKGNDSFFGSRGDDKINGGAGIDTAYYLLAQNPGTQGIDADIGRGTVIDTFGDTDTISNIESIVGSIFNDRIVGDAGDNNLAGFDGDDFINGKGGDDEITGGNGGDEMLGGKGDDRLYGSAGNDLIKGGKGNDTLLGEDNDDILLGGKGADELNGGDGDDTLDGGKGDDMLIGGDGADLFIIGIDGGDDIIEDFDVTLDTLQFEDNSNVTFSQQGDDVLFSNGNESALLLNNDVSDFII